MQYPKSSAVPGASLHSVVPPPVAPVVQPWTTGLYSCFDDCSTCCLTFWCPCITFGRIAHITDRGSTSCCGSATLWCFLYVLFGNQCKYSRIYRRRLRKQYNLAEEPCCDCCVQSCCESCSLCQMYRELQCRGFDMSLGYHENMQKRGHQINMQPPQAQEAMTR